jgi:uncharacterized protein (TIGR02284 family)
MQMQKDADLPGGIGASESFDVLSKLHKLSVDTRRGFEKMVEKAEVEFRPTAELFSTLHGRHVARLDTMLRDMGGLPDEHGSFMGSVNVAVVSLRAVFDAIDMEVMDSVRSGEENVLAAFDRAIAASLPLGARETLTQMKAEVTELLDQTRKLG